MWRFFYYPTEGGLVNMLLGAVGIEPQKWLSNPNLAMWAILIMTTWAGAGGAMMMYIAALQGIPASLYDAAEVDGANLWERIIHVALPQIRFIMLITLVGQIIGTMQIFMEPFIMTGGGPVNATYTVAMLQYDYAFRYSNYGAASALGLVVFVVLGGFSLFYTRMMIFRPQAREQN
jgi:multiple sugar transport system permease protein